MKTYTLDEVQDKLIGEKGTPKRDKFEYELRMDLIDKNNRKKQPELLSTQEETCKLNILDRNANDD